MVISLGAALGAGGLAYLIARAITGALLFFQQQQFLGAVAGALRGGVEGLGSGDLRAVRVRVRQIEAQNEELSLIIAFAFAALAVVAAYVWLERRAARRETGAL